jgi:hypothetical protein
MKWILARLMVVGLLLTVVSKVLMASTESSFQLLPYPEGGTPDEQPFNGLYTVYCAPDAIRPHLKQTELGYTVLLNGKMYQVLGVENQFNDVGMLSGEQSFTKLIVGRGEKLRQHWYKLAEALDRGQHKIYALRSDGTLGFKLKSSKTADGFVESFVLSLNSQRKILAINGVTLEGLTRSNAELVSAVSAMKVVGNGLVVTLKAEKKFGIF